MTDSNTSSEQKYQPKDLEVPSIYACPPQPLKALRYLLVDLFYPWGVFYIALAFPTWWYLTPSMETMAVLEVGWIALLWLRNCAILLLLAGTLHWCLHQRKCQGQQYMLNRKWLSADNKMFLWRNQLWDNMFWSIASGVTFWTAWEATSYWFYASGRIESPENSWYIVPALYLLFLWSTTNFFFVHRFLHWQPVYKRVHERHHRNVNIGPWSGISMHPLESLVYFSPFILWWFVPVDPVIIVLTGFYQGLNPALSHSGFDYLKVGKFRLKTGDWFHQLHHQYFNLNYGNTPAPLDKVFGSWHDGSKESLQAQKLRWLARRRKTS